MAAPFKNQLNALLRKNAVYQRRNVGSNICLLSAPILFCILLVIIQTIINRLFLSGADFKCGCKCTQCCPIFGTNISKLLSDGSMPQQLRQAGNINMGSIDPSRYKADDFCYAVEAGACPTDFGWKCNQFDSTKCGIQYSNGRQTGWCEVSHPSTWPAVFQLPEINDRAKQWAPNVPVFFTAKDANLASALPALLVPGPTIGSVSEITNLVKRLAVSENEVSGSDWLAALGLQFGTSSEPGVTAYFENAFTMGEIPEILVPESDCAARGLSNTTLPDFLVKWLSSGPNPNPIAAAAINATLTNRSMFSSTSAVAFNRVRVRCTEVPKKVFPSVKAMNEEIYCGYLGAKCSKRTTYNTYTGGMADNQYLGGWDFKDTSDSKLSVDMYFNNTVNLENGSNQPDRLMRVPAMLDNAIMAWGKYSLDNSRVAKLIGIQGFPKLPSSLRLDFSSLLGPLFYTWVVQLLLPTFLQQLVYEKEKRLRMMMKMHGLSDNAYWLITYCWYLMLYMLYMIIFIVFGSGVGLNIFRKTGAGVQAAFYFIFGNTLIAFAFMLSSLFSSSRTAVVFSFLYVFATGLIGELLLKAFINRKYSWMFFLQWVPAWSLYRALYEQAEYTFLAVFKNSDGLQFSNFTDKHNGMTEVMGILLVEWGIFMILALYFEQVLSNGTGVRKHPLFFLDWFTKKNNTEPNVMELASVKGAVRDAAQVSVAIPASTFEDVNREQERVASLSHSNNTPIVVTNLQKTYPAANGAKPKVAVQNLTCAIDRGECFGLLGPNGAGKSTSINMLVGFLEPSGGTAVVEGFDIRKEMDAVYNIMGVCPQHDLLWDQLTGREHLLFYGRLKGLTRAELQQAVESGLRSVNLFNGGVGNKQSRQYSGGMKRRLSVAISFMGQPKVVYLDEPSTGLDPASRRNLWDVVKNNKDGRSIILTTHSMEEAEILCDRLGIFVDGQLVCIGNPKEITSRFAGYLVFTLTVDPSHEDAAKRVVESMSANSKLTYSLGGTLKYELPTADISLSKVFEVMNATKASGRLNVLDWGVANATLEEVFIKLARDVGATTAEGH